MPQSDNATEPYPCPRTRWREVIHVDTDTVLLRLCEARCVQVVVELAMAELLQQLADRCAMAPWAPLPLEAVEEAVGVRIAKQ